MADKINGYGRGGVDITSTRLRAIERGEDARQSRKSESPSGSDEVQLTHTATSLKHVEARLAGMPDVDRARVDALRQRVESCNYRMDANRIAARLLRFARELT